MGTSKASRLVFVAVACVVVFAGVVVVSGAGENVVHSTYSDNQQTSASITVQSVDHAPENATVYDVSGRLIHDSNPIHRAMTRPLDDNGTAVITLHNGRVDDTKHLFGAARKYNVSHTQADQVRYNVSWLYVRSNGSVRRMALLLTKLA